MPEQEKLLYLNGLDAETGQPLIGPISYEDLTQRVIEVYGREQRSAEQVSFGLERFGAFDEYELDNPEQVGWGLLVSADEADEKQEWLADLIAHRNGRILLYQGESVREWKEQNRADDINPDHFPYYVLIAGSPSKVPYELQFSLDVLQAVGRIDFDSADAYARYAKTVVEQETGQATAPAKRAVFFAPRHPLDNATTQSSKRLVRPLRKLLPDSIPDGFVFEDLNAEQATKKNLITSLKPDENGRPPALLFSASHGAAVRPDPNLPTKQRILQGSIVCQDYDFPLTLDRQDGFVTGLDTDNGFSLPGGIHFFFACYGAGTRGHSDFARYVPSEEDRERLEATEGDDDFVAQLPKSLLANSNGGALAVVGHVDPAWVHSFESPLTKQRRINPFGLALARLLKGKPVGYSIMAFNRKYADLSVDLLSIVEDMQDFGIDPDPDELTDLWICRNDAQNYVIVGDPAVTLRFG